MPHYSTETVPMGQRVQFWNELCGSLYSPLAIDPVDLGTFTGDMDVLYDGAFKVSHFCTTPVHMQRTRAHAKAATSTALTAFLRMKGQATFTVNGAKLAMATGDVMLLDAHTAFEFMAEEVTGALAIGIPENFVAAHLPNVDRIVGRMLDATLAIHPIIVSTMRYIGDQAEMGLAPSAKLLRGMLELISGSIDDPVCESSLDTSAHVQRWQRRAMSLISANLRDPRLTAGRVAATLGISPRYLRMIFAGLGETVTGCIQRIRLEEGAKCLLNPSWRDVPLADIASHWGFEDPAYFSRCFRVRFGVSPTQYRQSIVH